MKVNWVQYYREFCRVHGGNPVVYKANPEVKNSGFLLFPDGWRYGRSDPSGPEYCPPDDPGEHITLIRHYWRTRRRIMEGQYQILRENIISLVRAQQNRSAALQVPVNETDDEGTKRVVYKDVDFESLVDRLRALSDEIVYCERQAKDVTIPKVDEFDLLDVVEKLEEVDNVRRREKELREMQALPKISESTESG